MVTPHRYLARRLSFQALHKKFQRRASVVANCDLISLGFETACFPLIPNSNFLKGVM
jgi:hypothetical protein